MTTYPTPPTAGVDLPDGVEELHRVLDRLHGAVPRIDADRTTAMVVEVERALRRLESLKLTLLAHADRCGIATRSGFTGTEAWAARQTTSSRADAARQVALARELAATSPGDGSGERPGEPPATERRDDAGADANAGVVSDEDVIAGSRATAAALEQGLLSSGHAAVIVGALRELPAGVGPDQHRAVEAFLVEQSSRYNPEQLRRAARRALAAVEPDERTVDAHEDILLRSEEAEARRRATFTWHEHADGTTSGRFTVPTVSARFLLRILDAMTAPRRRTVPAPATTPVPQTDTDHDRPDHDRPDHDRPDHDRPDHDRPDHDRPADWRHRRGLAFADLLAHLPTDHLHSATSATVVVTVDHETLTGALRAARIDTGDQLSAGETRRLACRAGLLPAVLGTRSVALDLGRETRLFTRSQRVAAGLRHETCAAIGCQRPYAWCELHHRRPWSAEGRTDLANAVPLCSWHHHRVHDPGYASTWHPDGTLALHRVERCVPAA